MTQTVLQTMDIFGISRELPLNYVERKKADGEFIDSLTRQKHIVVHGSSKQGKTSLRKKCLNENEYILVSCNNRWDLKQLHEAILKQAGYRIRGTDTESISEVIRGDLKTSASFNAGIAKVSAETGGGADAETTKTETSEALQLDLSDVNDVILALKEIDLNKFIILEDFHYLPTETQKDFSFALKTFHESSKYCFIVVGVWLEENRLISHNGDLTGRVISINADSWQKDELTQVIQSGCRLLNIEFSEELINEIVSCSFDNVYMVQEICYRICEQEEIRQTQETLRHVENVTNIRDIVKDVVGDQTARYNYFINHFSTGFQQSELEMYRWLLLPILISSTQDLESGIPRNILEKIIKTRHPKGQDLNSGNVTQALQNVASLQVKKDIKPIIIDYNHTSLKLNIVDRSFLIWLENQDRDKLLKDANFTFSLKVIDTELEEQQIRTVLQAPE